MELSDQASQINPNSLPLQKPPEEPLECLLLKRSWDLVTGVIQLYDLHITYNSN